MNTLMKNNAFLFEVLLVIILMLFGITSCKDRGEKLSPVAESEDTRIHSTNFDGCEYLFFTYADGSISSLTHKGNCRNKVHQVPPADSK